MKNFKPYKITGSKPNLKVSRKLLELSLCAICKTQIDNTKYCAKCSERLINFKKQIDKLHENTTIHKE